MFVHTFATNCCGREFLEINYHETYVSARDVKSSCNFHEAQDGLTMPFKCRRRAHWYLSGAGTVSLKMRLRAFRLLRGAVQKKWREFVGSTAAFSNMTTALAVW